MTTRKNDRKISNFLGQTAIPTNTQMSFISGGTNYRITIADFLASIGVTGTIEQAGDPLGTPILDQSSPVNKIRNLESGPGVRVSTSPLNGVTIEHDFKTDIIGAQLVNDLSLQAPTFRSLVSGAGINISESGNQIQVALSGAPASTKTVIVNSITDFPLAVGGVIPLADNTEYLLRNDITTFDRFAMGANTVISGADSLLITINYTNTGTVFTSVNKSWTVKNINIQCPLGKFVSFTDTNTEVLQVIDCEINALILGVIDGFKGVRFDNLQITAANDGFTFNGTNGVFLCNDMLATMNNGVLFKLSTTTFNGFSVNGSFITLNGTSNFLFGAANSANITAGNIGSVINTRFYGTGTPLNIITSKDIRWQFFVNDTINDTNTSGLISLNGNAVNTVIAAANTPVKVAGVWVNEHEERMTGDASGRLTYDSENTLDMSISMSISCAPVSGAKGMTFYYAKDGAIVPNSGAFSEIASGRPTQVTVTWLDSLTTGNYIELFVENNDDAVDILVSDAVIRIIS